MFILIVFVSLEQSLQWRHFIDMQYVLSVFHSVSVNIELMKDD